MSLFERIVDGLDSARRETYERMREGADLDTVLAYLSGLVAGEAGCGPTYPMAARGIRRDPP